MISCRLPGKTRSLTSAQHDRDTVPRRRLLHIAQDVFAQAVSVGENLVQAHRSQRPPGRELDVGIEPRRIVIDDVQCRTRIDDPELNQNTDPNRHLVGGENLLALDRQFPFADVDQHDLDLRPAKQRQIDIARDSISPRLQHLHHPAVFVPDATVCLLDGYLAMARPHGSFDVACLDWTKKRPRSGVEMEYEFSDGNPLEPRSQ